MKLATVLLSFIALAFIAIKIIVTTPSLESLVVYVPLGFDKINAAQLAYVVIAAMFVLAIFTSRDSVSIYNNNSKKGAVILTQ